MFIKGAYLIYYCNIKITGDKYSVLYSEMADDVCLSQILLDVWLYSWVRSIVEADTEPCMAQHRNYVGTTH